MNSTYLVHLTGDRSESDSDSRQTIGLLHGSYQLFQELPSSCLLPISDEIGTNQFVELTTFTSYSEEDELAEFRLLNHKDRVIIRSIESEKSVVFGLNRSKQLLQPQQQQDQYCAFDVNGTLVVRGPVYIRQQSSSFGDQNNISGDSVRNSNNSSSRDTMVKYSGQLTINITGFALVNIGQNWQQGITIVLPDKSKFAVERNIPHRFQQRTIVQRQKDKFQSIDGMMALETFEHLLC